MALKAAEAKKTGGLLPSVKRPVLEATGGVRG
jgi:hypothetical protein